MMHGHLRGVLFPLEVESRRPPLHELFRTYWLFSSQF